MTRACKSIGALAIVVVAGCAEPTGSPGEKVRRPDVLMVVVDALRADRLGCYGYPRDTSPAMDSLADDGVLFEHAIAQSTFTGCSVASLFTGLNPHNHGLYWGSQKNDDNSFEAHVLDPVHDTLAELLSDRGATSVAWYHNRMLRRGLGFEQGFAEYVELQGDKQDVGGRIIDTFLDWHAQHHGESRFFAYLHLLDLHDPYQPRSPFDTFFGDPQDLLGVPRHETAWRTWAREVNRGERTISPLQLAGLADAYDGVIRSVDGHLSRLVRALRERDAYDDTLIVVTADHGDGFMEHGFLSHGKAPYIELVHVPLILKLPGTRHRGVRVSDQVRLVDLLPTVLEIAGGDGVPFVPPGVDGRSLMPLVADRIQGTRRPQPPREAISEILVGGAHLTIAVRDESSMYLHRSDGADELYDLSRDPREQHDLVGTGLEVETRLRRRALEVAATAADLRPATIHVTPEELEQIRALGYVE